MSIYATREGAQGALDAKVQQYRSRGYTVENPRVAPVNADGGEVEPDDAAFAGYGYFLFPTRGSSSVWLWILVVVVIVAAAVLVGKKVKR